MEVEIKPEDISVNQVPGGTAWFPTFNGVQVTHIPTQCSVTCTEERSAHRNRAVAMEMLREKLKTWVAPVIPLAAEEIIDIIASECRNSCYDKDHAIAYFNMHYAGRFEKDYLHCIIHIIDFDALRQVDHILNKG